MVSTPFPSSASGTTSLGSMRMTLIPLYTICGPGTAVVKKDNKKRNKTNVMVVDNNVKFGKNEEG